ncbi:MAG: hypothetical protein Tsb0014_21950 [Pleurocapsa sp.]
MWALNVKKIDYQYRIFTELNLKKKCTFRLISQKYEKRIIRSDWLSFSNKDITDLVTSFTK